MNQFSFKFIKFDRKQPWDVLMSQNMKKAIEMHSIFSKYIRMP